VEGSDDIDVVDIWTETLEDEKSLVRILVDQTGVEPLIDLAESRYSGIDSLRIVVLSVETSLPRADEGDEEAPETLEEAAEEEKTPFFPRISRDELFDSVIQMAELDGHFLSFVFLATIVAAIGLLQNNVAVIIGSMVIAPLLGPVVCLSLATVLADADLARQAAVSNAVGLTVTLAGSVALGVALPVDPAIPEIARRTNVSLWDVGLGLAVGAAGSLSFTTGLSTALVGVMVAVALLPPLVTAGLLFGDAHMIPASRATLQALVYLISINLAGVAVFALQGIRPANWWEEDQARRATRLALLLSGSLLAALAAIVWYAGAA
jgi:uncharacterized hydrophobic protein (TIGR00341 family)